MPYVYAFEEGSKEQKYLLGGKGANLAEMTKLGLPVPPGFTITTDACKAYMAAGDSIPDGLMDEVAAALAALEAKMGKQLGDADRPAARVGALGRAVLDAGDDGHRPQPRAQRRVGRRAREADRQRALRVRLLPPLRADVRQDRARRRRRASSSTRSSELRDGAWRRHRPRARRPTTSQGLVETVQGDRARGGRASSSRRTRRSSSATRSKRCSARGTASARAIYRRMEKIPDDLGTAVNVQTMVFGNKGDDSGTGVAFTRDPATGENRALRRLPAQRAGRRRRRRHPHHRAARRDGATTFPECHTAAARR